MIERGELVAAIKKRRLPMQQRQQPVASRPAGHPGRKVAAGFVQPMRCYNLDDIDDISTYLVMEKFDGGPVGLDNVAAAIGEESGTLEDVIGPYLIQQGLLMRTPRGRVATPAAYRHFGLNPPRNSTPAGDLFAVPDNDS